MQPAAAGPYQPAYPGNWHPSCYCAGIYRVRARVCVADLSSSNTSMTLQIYQNMKAGGNQRQGLAGSLWLTAGHFHSGPRPSVRG
jgi:hypothetical protein